MIKNKNYQEQLESRNKLVQLEQQSLNASMNRHFIFNSLNAIQYFINSSDKLAANRFLNRFAKLIRKNLDASNQKKGLVTLQDELERLELYMELENMRFNNRFSYEVNVEEFIETEALHVPAMFLQPFVENSIIHGVLPLKNRVGEVKVLVTDHLDHIRIEIRDNGIGIDQSREVKKDVPGDHKSQGMLITKGRIELLQKFSAKSIVLIGPRQINEEDGSVKGTQVIFKILKVYLEE
jgi:LytS/YehU family sensor histidine kinase